MPTPKMELTRLKLEGLMPAESNKQYEIADTLVSGLRVRVSDDAVPAGRFKGKAAIVTFVLAARYPPSKHPTRRSLGRFSRDGLSLTLQEAREKARLWKSKIATGIDPVAEEQQQREAAEREKAEAEEREAKAEEARRNQKTLKDILDQYETEKLASLSTGAATRRALDGKEGLLKGLVDQDPASVSRADILEAVKAKAKTAPTSANRQLAYAKAFFNWCVDEGILEASPAENVKKPSKENTRDRFHSVDELREIWSAMGTLGYPFGQMFRLLTVVPMRREEIAAIRLKELDLADDDAPHDAVWTLPADRTKKRNALRVPLPKLARSIVREALADSARPSDSKFLFSTTGTTSSSGFSKAKKRLDDEIADRRKKAAAELRGEPEAMEHWVLHDLRTTFNTVACDELEIEPHVADRILNHVATATTSKIMRVYNRSELFGPRKRALRMWADYLERNVILQDDDVDEPEGEDNCRVDA